MSLTAFQRYRRLKQVEEMKPENITKQNIVTEEPVENFTETSLVPDEPVKKETSKTAARRNSKK